MTPEQQRRVRDLFEAALDREGPDARLWLEQAAVDDPVVRDEVLSLLDHHSRAGKFLVQSVGEALPELFPELLAGEDLAFAPGTTIGTYTIERELGRGGMGRVYLASDSHLGRRVALKALAPHLVSDPRQRERLKREARIAAGLTHPGICTVYALEEIDGSFYIATEFVDGRTLRDEIQSGRRPSPPEILGTARELSAALAAAHAAGVVHRDLKPENVMRTADGRLKILDFGLARLDRPDRAAAFVSQPGAVFGTPAYMAPEQINGEPVDARADVFAFGVLLYEYAGGLHPFEATNPLAIAGRVLNGDVPPLSSRSVDAGPLIDHVIARCLRKTPAERYASAVELSEALRRDTPLPLPPSVSHRAWWRIHQIAIIVLYIASVVAAWLVKSKIDTPVTLGLFLALSAVSTLGCVLRGHLMFTERVKPRRFARERNKTARPLVGVDLTVAVLLIGAAVAIAGRSAVAAAATIGLGLSLGAAALFLEPSTTDEAFPDDNARDRNPRTGRT